MQPRIFIRVNWPEPDGPTMATISPAWIVSSTSFSTMIFSSPEGDSRRALLRAISGRRPVSGTVIRLEPERTATAAALRCRRAAVGHPGHHALPLAKAVAHLDADLVEIGRASGRASVCQFV